jgi:hypothetical protein
MTSTTTIYEYEHAHEREHEGFWGKARRGGEARRFAVYGAA